MSSSFKSTTKRTSISGAGDNYQSHQSRSHRRSRSLNRFSTPTTPARRGKFVNTSRGAGFPEISLDDLALEFFESADRWRSENSSNSSSESQMRGRSVSRQLVDGGSWSRCDGRGRAVQQDSAKSRRRSFSVARYHNSDTESEVEAIGNIKKGANQKRSSFGSGVTNSFQKTAVSNQRQLSRRSLSSKDLLKLQDGYSSHSSALTDEEPRKTGFRRNGVEKTIRTVSAQKVEHPIGEDINTGLYNAMRKELRNAVEDIRLDLEQAMVQKSMSNSSESFEPVSVSMGNNGSKLDKKQEISDEILMDVDLDPEISKIVSDFLLDSENDTVVEKKPRAKKRSNDNRRMSTELIQEAEQYFEDFLSNVEDTDLSSFEGERSDCGSCVGRIKRNDTFQTPAKSSIPVEMDDVILPWLHWETTNDSSPGSCNKNSDVASATASSNPPEDDNTSYHMTTQDQYPMLEDNSENGCITSASPNKAPYFDIDKYTDIARNEKQTLESWRHQSRINSGSIHFCSTMFL